MKRSILAAGCTLAAALTFAAPSPRWVPATADFVVVGENSGGNKAAIDAAWKKAFKEAAGVELPENTSLTAEQWREISPNLPALLKALGASDDLQTYAPCSAVYALALPQSAEAMKGDELPKDTGVYAMYESAAIDLPALDKAVTALCAEERERVTFTFKKTGEWRSLTMAAKGAKDEPQKKQPFFGYRPVKGGLAFVFCADQATAEAWVSGKMPAISADSPLMEAFKPIAGSEKQWTRIRLADLAGVIKRLTDANAQKNLATKAPLLQKIRNVGMDCSYKGVNAVVAFTATTADETSATQLRDFLLGWKGLLTQMMLPMLTQKPDSSTATMVTSIACEAKGKAVSMSLEVTPELGAKVVKEFQEIAERQAAEASVSVDVEGLDDEEEDGDAEPMSEEEARKILDNLDVK